MFHFRALKALEKSFYASQVYPHISSVCRNASSVYVVNENVLTKSQIEKETCNRLLLFIKHKQRHNLHVNLGTIEKTTNLLLRHDLLNESNARLLISACGNNMVYHNNKKTAQAQKIFDVVDKKSTALANELLKVLLENGMSFDFSQILKRYDRLNIIPDENTFVRLIAGNCLEGKMKLACQVLPLFYEHGFEIPTEVYGYFAFALCERGSSEAAIKLTEQLLKHEEKLSWDLFYYLLLGLTKQTDLSVVDDVVEKFEARLDRDLSTSSLVKIYKEFLKRGIGEKAFDMMKFARVRHLDVQKCAENFKQIPVRDAAPFLKHLLTHFRGYLKSGSLPIPLRIILLDCLRRGKSFDDYWNEMLFMKQFDQTLDGVEFLAFALLVSGNSEYCELFVNRLSERGIRFSLPISTHFTQSLEKIKVDQVKIEKFVESLEAEKKFEFESVKEPENDEEDQYKVVAHN